MRDASPILGKINYRDRNVYWMGTRPEKANGQYRIEIETTP
jgi:hypothetical protein